MVLIMADISAIGPKELRDSQCIRQITTSYTKTLGIEWNAPLDHFRLIVTSTVSSVELTKRQLVSDIAKTYDVLGWFSPVIVTAKILLQRLWEERLQWDDPVPDSILAVWSRMNCHSFLLITFHDTTSTRIPPLHHCSYMVFLMHHSWRMLV